MKAMKKILTAIALLATAALLSGCQGVHKALRITQEIEGSGSVTIETHAQLTTVVVDNARQEEGMFKADQLDLVHRGKITGSKVDIHLKPYARPILGPGEK